MSPVSLTGHVSFTDAIGAHLQAKMSLETTVDAVRVTIAPVTPGVLLPPLHSTDPSVALFLAKWVALIVQASGL